MDAFVQGAVAGLTGGVLGAAVGWLIQRIAKKKLAWARYIPLAGVAVALLVARGELNNPALQVLDEMAKKIDTIAALKAHYPADYALLREAVKGIDPAASAPDVQNVIRPIIANVIRRQLPKASPENAYDMMRLAADQAAALRNVDPAACMSMIIGSTSDRDMRQVMPDEMRRRELEATARMFNQTATDPLLPAPPLGEEELIEFTVAALERLRPENRMATVDLMDKSPSSASPRELEMMCDFYIASLNEVLSLPKPVAGVKARSLFASRL